MSSVAYLRLTPASSRPLKMLCVAADLRGKLAAETAEEDVVLAWKERALKAEAALEAINKQLRELVFF